MGTSQKTLFLFWRANMAHKKLFIGTLVSWAVGLLLQKILLPFIAARAINELVKLYNQPGTNYIQVFAPYLIGFVVVVVAAQAFVDGGLLLLSKLETKVRPELQIRVFNLLMNQSLTFHANNFSGSLVNQTSKFTGAYVSLTDIFTIQIMLTVITSLFAILVTAFFLPLVALGMLLWTVFFVWLSVTLTRKRIYLSRAAAEADSVLTGHLADAIGNIAAIKAFGREGSEETTHQVKNLDRAHKKYLSWVRGTRNDFTIGLMMGLLQFSVLALLIYSGANGIITVGTLLLVQVYTTQLIGQLWSVSNITRNIEQGLSDAAEMTEILDAEIAIKDPPHPQKMHVAHGKIDFDNVQFTHDGSNDALFAGFNLHVKAGEKVGLVGHSGSGKTSLTRLLLRFVDIDGGAITIDGQNISSVAQADLREHIAYVPQEPLLFHRSLRENIAYGRPDATDEEVKHAAELAHAADFIKDLPKGYDTMVGERGVKLSGGQRQRIAIARAILKDAPILVLDEATSALDSESEKLIQDALKKLMKGRTTIVIAHRLSTVQKMDRIIVLQSGRISEQGSHTELLAQGGVYADLWAHQSGGFLKGD